MNAEKHVLPILLIVLVLVTLVSTYAWFAVSSAEVLKVSIELGSVTTFTINAGQSQSGSNFNFEDVYSGQKGYKPDGTPYTDADAPFYLFKTISYEMSGQSDTIVDVLLEKLTVQVGGMYLYSFNQTLKNVVGLSDDQISALTNSTILNYYVTATDYASDATTLPTGANPSPIYMVCEIENDEITSITHIIYTSTVVQTYVTYDYWVSNGTDNDGDGVLPTDPHASKKGTGIQLQYIEQGQSYDSTHYDGAVCKTGYTNYVGIYAGFYGFDGNKPTECVFSNKNFQGSTFTFTFSAGGM